MKHKLFVALAIIGLIPCIADAQDFKQIHKDILVVDGHNDVIISSILRGKDIGQRLTTGHTDLPRLQEGGVDVQLFAVYSNDLRWKSGAFKHANDQIDALEKVIAENPTKIALATSTSAVDSVQRLGKIAAVIGIESGNMIESSITNLEALYNRGARYLTLTWNYNLPWATAAAVEDSKPKRQQKGLSKQGVAIIKRMNELGMMADLSHGSKKLFYDVIKASTKPILVSHSNAAALMPHSRNLDDKQLAALKKNRGVIGVNFYSGFLDPGFEGRVKSLYAAHSGISDSKESVSKQYSLLPKELKYQADAPLSVLIDHIDYLVSKVGIDHVAIGSDYDGIESAPQGLEDVSKLPLLTQALFERGYSQDDIAKIMGLNFMRIWRENESK